MAWELVWFDINIAAVSEVYFAKQGSLMEDGRKHLVLRPQKPLRLIRDGEVAESGILYLTPTEATRYTVTT